MTPEELIDLCTSINGGATIDQTLLQSLLNQGRTILFNERPWMFLRKTDTSITVSANQDSWNTSILISGITDFLRFLSTDLGNKSYSIILFDGINRTEYFRQVPFSKRLQYKDVPNTFVHDIAGKKMYFNSQIPFAGTLHVNYISTPPRIDLDDTDALEVSGVFPAPREYQDILAYYAVGINKGAVDYDSINREMLPNNQAVLNSMKNAMEKWDTNLQLDEQMSTDPTGGDTGFPVAGRVNMN